ncbi:Cytoplasmic phosphatidylinositol transfer protein 1, partial [Balamuthia mandrillaris]
ILPGNENKCPLLGNRFQIRAETYYRDDRGRTSAVHNKTFSPEERRHCKVDVINIGKEKLEPKYYQHNEDPSLYASEKTKRGPLKANWVYTTKPVMCAYKLLCVRFDYWGLKHKVEALTHQIFRTVYLQSHQQAFCWLDEWVDMTEEQIEQLEKETIEELNNKFQQQKHSASSTGVIHQKANL